MIGCRCAVCRSEDPRNRRKRCSLYIREGGTHLVIDTPPDFREQVLAYGVERVDALFFTHAHADHIFGLDDLRRFCALQKSYIPAYGSPETIRQIRSKFDYVDRRSHSFGGVPRIRFREMREPVGCGNFRIIPLEVRHGREAAYGYRIDAASGGSVAYIPDCNEIPDAAMTQLAGVSVMILDGLRPERHPTHFSIPEAVEHLGCVAPERAFVTHLAHNSEHTALERELAPRVEVPWDGLEIEV